MADDLTVQLVDLINSVTDRPDRPHTAHGHHGFYAFCPICSGNADEIAAAIMPGIAALIEAHRPIAARCANCESEEFACSGCGVRLEP